MKMHNDNKLNVEKLQGGTYILTIEYDAGEKESVKFIKK
jgi:hypothetical protein